MLTTHPSTHMDVYTSIFLRVLIGINSEFERLTLHEKWN